MGPNFTLSLLICVKFWLCHCKYMLTKNGYGQRYYIDSSFHRRFACVLACVRAVLICSVYISLHCFKIGPAVSKLSEIYFLYWLTFTPNGVVVPFCVNLSQNRKSISLNLLTATEEVNPKSHRRKGSQNTALYCFDLNNA